MQPDPTMCQILTGLAGELGALELNLRGDIVAVPDSVDRVGLVTALDALNPAVDAVEALPDAADAAVGDNEYRVTAALLGVAADLTVAMARVPALLSARGLAGADILTRLTALADRILTLITTAHRPRVGYPSVGFEYELPGVTIEGEIPAKTLIASWQHDNVDDVRLESDGGHCEFVTSPVTTLVGLNRQLTTIRAQLTAMRQAGRTVFEVPEPIRSAEDGRILHATGHEVTVVHAEGESRGRIQGTAACPLADLPEMVTLHANGVGIDQYGDDPAHLDAVALARMVAYYLASLDNVRSAADPQGPKVKLPVMLRTSLRALYMGMAVGEQTEFRDLVEYQQDTDLRRGRLIPQRYRGPGGATENGPTIGAWVDSIIDGCPTTVGTEPRDRDNDGTGPRGPHHDLMSPPPGYPAHRKGRHFTYAMGYFGRTGDGSALVEVREIWRAGNYGLDNFENQAREFAAQRFETAANRRARLQALVNAAVAHVCANRAVGNGDVGRVRSRLAITITVANERILAGPMIQPALDAWVYVPPVPPPQNLKRKPGDQGDRGDGSGKDVRLEGDTEMVS